MPQCRTAVCNVSLVAVCSLCWHGGAFRCQSPLHYSQSDASYVGLASIVGCCLGGVVLGLVGDRVSRLKPILAALSFLSVLPFVWFTLVVNRILPPSRWQLFLSGFIGSFTLNAGSGLYYEAAAELYVSARG